MHAAVSRPCTVARYFAAAMAGLVLLVHGVLQPAHLASHHGGVEEQAHLAAHQGEHAGHAHHQDGGPADHSDEHDAGDHGGTGHLLEVVPSPGPAANLDLELTEGTLAGEALLVLVNTRTVADVSADEVRPRPPPRGPAPSRAPPIG